MRKITMMFVAVAAVMFVASAIRTEAQEEKVLTVTGVVVVEKDDAGKVTKLSVVDEGGTEFVFENDAKLAEHDTKDVTVNYVEKVVGDKKTLVVKDFKIIETEIITEE